MRCTLTIALHWSTGILLLFVLGDGGSTPWLAYAYSAAALSFCALAMVFGLMNGPGAKLEGVARIAHPYANRAMYLIVAWGAIALLAQTMNQQVPGPPARILLLSLIVAALLHGIFNLWRHTALGDGALRRMTPKALHHML